MRTGDRRRAPRSRASAMLARGRPTPAWRIARVSSPWVHGPMEISGAGESYEELGADAAWQRLTERTRELGFECWSYGALPWPTPLRGSRHVAVTTYPAGHVATYRAQRLDSAAPGPDFVRRAEGPETFAQVRERARTSLAFEELLDLNRRFRVRQGVLLPLQNVLGMRAWLGLCHRGDPARLDDIWQTRRTTLEDLARQLNRAILRRHAPTFAAPFVPGLVDRQREVVRQLALGASTEEAADLLQISIHTLNKHIAIAKRALGAQTSAQLVSLCTRWGLID